MTDQERITDFLCSEKKMTANYDSFASECVNIPLRDEFLRLFNQSHHSQTELFQTAQERGWYSRSRPRVTRSGRLTPNTPTSSPPASSKDRRPTARAAPLGGCRPGLPLFWDVFCRERLKNRRKSRIILSAEAHLVGAGTGGCVAWDPCV